MMRVSGSRAGAVAAAGLIVLAGCAEKELSAPPPDVVLITIDTLRADRLGCYGYFRETTPRLDQLAAESVLFERCLAPIAVTYPSHLSLLTSVHPAACGAQSNCATGGVPFAPTAELRTLPMVLREAGYETAAFVSATPLKRHCGLDAGFDVYDVPTVASRNATATNLATARWLARRGDAPLFLWVHYYDPHDSYTPPGEFAEMWRADAEQGRYLRERGFREETAEYQPELSLAEYNNLYDGEVSFTDFEIGRLLDVLRTDPDRWERTVVVVVGDHGEGLGQHGEVYHDMVWEEHLRVPLLIRVPGVAPRRVPHLMAMADVVPTLFGLADLPGEESYLAQATGEDRIETAAVALLGQESNAPWRTEKRGRRWPHYCLTERDWKLVHDPHGEDRLYRIGPDPHELRDVSAEYPEIVARMRRTLIDQLVVVREQAAERRGRPEIDPRILDEMRSLGYVK